MFAACPSGLRFTLVALGASAMLVPGIPGSAAADPQPKCTTADMTAVMSGVSAALAACLVTHPDVNDFFTGLQGLPKNEVATRTRCNLPQRALILADL